MNDARPDLARAAYTLADEYRAGQCRTLEGRSWRETWQRLIDELARRCPGHSADAYHAALDRGFVESR
jgi:hypothetical protein